MTDAPNGTAVDELGPVGSLVVECPAGQADFSGAVLTERRALETEIAEIRDRRDDRGDHR